MGTPLPHAAVLLRTEHAVVAPGGRLELNSPAGAGTRLGAEIPCG